MRSNKTIFVNKRYPLKTVDEVISQVPKAKVLIKLDATNGYFGIFNMTNLARSNAHLIHHLEAIDLICSFTFWNKFSIGSFPENCV